MEEDWEEPYCLMPNPLEYFTKLIFLQADLIYGCLVFLFSPIFFLLSIVSESYHRAEKAVNAMESAVQKIPATIVHGSTVLLKKLTLGFLGAAYVFMVLTVVLVIAVVLGVGLVQLYVDHPVFVREKLYIDYAEPYPKALFCFGSMEIESTGRRKHLMGVPRGHTFQVSLVLLLPESDFNRKIGVFQLSAELLSANGAVIAKSSRPCMLRFRSFPVRLARIFLMGIPLLLGISSETQKISIEMLKHKEGTPRTKCIRVTLIPRAGTLSAPQLYEAEILIESQLPWTKELVRSWKWTLSVWTSLYMYIMFLIVLVYRCQPLIFPITATNLIESSDRELTFEEPIEPRTTASDEVDVSELLKKWNQSRNDRKAIYWQEAISETVGSSTSSIRLTREDTSTGTTVEEDNGDSELVCFGC